MSSEDTREKRKNIENSPKEKEQNEEESPRKIAKMNTDLRQAFQSNFDGTQIGQHFDLGNSAITIYAKQDGYSVGNKITIAYTGARSDLALFSEEEKLLFITVLTKWYLGLKDIGINVSLKSFHLRYRSRTRGSLRFENFWMCTDAHELFSSEEFDTVLQRGYELYKDLPIFTGAELEFEVDPLEQNQSMVTEGSNELIPGAISPLEESAKFVSDVNAMRVSAEFLCKHRSEITSQKDLDNYQELWDFAHEQTNKDFILRLVADLDGSEYIFQGLNITDQREKLFRNYKKSINQAAIDKREFYMKIIHITYFCLLRGTKFKKILAASEGKLANLEKYLTDFGVVEDISDCKSNNDNVYIGRMPAIFPIIAGIVCYMKKLPSDFQISRNLPNFYRAFLFPGGSCLIPRGKMNLYDEYTRYQVDLSFKLRGKSVDDANPRDYNNARMRAEAFAKTAYNSKSFTHEERTEFYQFLADKESI